MRIKPVALVTGAGRGIGRSIALELAREGFDIAGCDVVYEPENRVSGLFEVREAVRAAGGQFLPIPGDVSLLDSHNKILAGALEGFGRVDTLVNNAGIAPEVRTDILHTAPESFDRVMNVNVRGTFFLTQRIVAEMISEKKKDPERTASVIFISSISAYVSSTSRPEYCISKAALSMAARLYADRLADVGINVYEIRPGIIRTDMTEPVREKYDRLILEGLVPQMRWGFPEDVGKAAAALAKGYFPYSTGLILEVSGGMNIRRL
jgi:3-oxoacyl-[acyl-carrier protein] reductase